MFVFLCRQSTHEDFKGQNSQTIILFLQKLAQTRENFLRKCISIYAITILVVNITMSIYVPCCFQSLTTNYVVFTIKSTKDLQLYVAQGISSLLIL